MANENNHENKYMDIAIGNVRYIQASVRYGWGTSKWFWVPGKVTRVTATMFIVAGGKYRKNNGTLVSSTDGGEAARLGDNVTGYMRVMKVCVTNETAARDAFVAQLRRTGVSIDTGGA